MTLPLGAPPPPTLQEWTVREIDHALSEIDMFPSIAKTILTQLRDVVGGWPNVTYLGVPLADIPEAAR